MKSNCFDGLYDKSLCQCRLPNNINVTFNDLKHLDTDVILWSENYDSHVETDRPGLRLLKRMEHTSTTILEGLKHSKNLTPISRDKGFIAFLPCIRQNLRKPKECPATSLSQLSISINTASLFSSRAMLSKTLKAAIVFRVKRNYLYWAKTSIQIHYYQFCVHANYHIGKTLIPHRKPTPISYYRTKYHSASDIWHPRTRKTDKKHKTSTSARQHSSTSTTLTGEIDMLVRSKSQYWQAVST